MTEEEDNEGGDLHLQVKDDGLHFDLRLAGAHITGTAPRRPLLSILEALVGPPTAIPPEEDTR